MVSFPTDAALHRIHSDKMPELGVWTHLAATFDAYSRTLRFYINGTPQGQPLVLPAETVPRKVNGPLIVGANGLGSGDKNWWMGDIDEVAAFSGPLDDLQIGQLATRVGRVPKQVPISGDFNGDGKTDIAMFLPARHLRTQTKLWMFYSTGNGFDLEDTDGDGMPDKPEVRWESDPAEDWALDRLRIDVGDTNGDNRLDLILTRTWATCSGRFGACAAPRSPPAPTPASFSPCSGGRTPRGGRIGAA